MKQINHISPQHQFSIEQYCLQKNLKTKFKSKQVNQFQTILNELKKISNSKVSTSFSILNSYTIFKGHVKSVMWTTALFTFWTQCYSSCKIWLYIYYTEFLTIFWFATLVNEYRLEIQFKKLRKVRNIQGRNLRGYGGEGGWHPPRYESSRLAGQLWVQF
jgi:hypothetical protein